MSTASRRRPIDLPHPIAFVLGGGGSFGAVQVGMLEALGEIRLAPDLVVGTSIGAINGALLAEDPEGAADRLARLWPAVTRERVFPGGAMERMRTWRRNRTHLVRHDALRDFLTENLETERIEELRLPFAAVATDLASGASVRLESGLLVPALLASAAIPGLYPHVRIDGRDLVDGGVVRNVPIAHALELGANSIVVLDCGVVSMDPKAPSLADTVAHTMAMMTHQQLGHQLETAAAQRPVLYLPGPEPLIGSALEFTRTLRRIRDAYEASRTFLADLELDGPGLYGRPPPISTVAPPQPPGSRV